MKIEAATNADYAYLQVRDHHIVQSLICKKINEKEIYMLRDDNKNNIGWLRFGYFWDNTPFMNMLWLEEPHRGQGFGKEAVLYWEEEMRNTGFNVVMTSTLASEGAQYFYRKLGYRDAGCLLLENEPLEIIMIKQLGN
ncbi:GNAT family acetyltransferase [Paenibacillus oryzisoli]|uniref:GNAT family acetyltransferase n=1 Tax=Paenibacillus oryzisoli TaxID=1850517 RepID=A0A198APD2_9BACL|nr:GNAT family N-acetyltransferase [Paenibacillus oryzisoli]OAS22743.1 GNAT family acetyltransferase [Paenibacillus oryzisoli]